MNPFKYNECKETIQILLQDMGHYRFSMDLENEPNSIIEKAKWHNRLDEAYGFFFLSISLDILFHIDVLTTPN